MAKPITTVSQMFPREWLHPDDLLKVGKVECVIERAQVEDRFNPRTKREEPRLIVYFFQRNRHLICNKTQAFELADVTGTEAFGEWKGHSVILARGIAPNRKPTVTISPAPTAPTQETAQEDAQEADPDDDPDDSPDDDDSIHLDTVGVDDGADGDLWA